VLQTVLKNLLDFKIMKKLWKNALRTKTHMSLLNLVKYTYCVCQPVKIMGWKASRKLFRQLRKQLLGIWTRGSAGERGRGIWTGVTRSTLFALMHRLIQRCSLKNYSKNWCSLLYTTDSKNRYEKITEWSIKVYRAEHICGHTPA
jgi:hypothetical protein